MCAALHPAQPPGELGEARVRVGRGAHEEYALAAAAGVLGKVQRLAVVDDGDVAAQRPQVALRVMVQVLRAPKRR